MKLVKLVVARGQTSGTEFILQPGSNLIGRWDPEAGVFPEVDLENHDPEAKVSRRHALVEWQGDQILIEDIGSMNGTFVNRGPKLVAGVKQPLKDGDELIVGKTFLQVSAN